jgi:uroporphyrinogen-III synthase
MVKAWHIIAETKHAGEESDVPPFREYFVVAVSHADHAAESLQMRKNLSEAKLTVVGEATADFIEKSNIKDGEIISVGAYSSTPA